MNRRGFLAGLAASLVAPDPDKLLWVPGRKLISIPRPCESKGLHLRGNRILTREEWLAELDEIWRRVRIAAADSFDQRVADHFNARHVVRIVG